MSAKTRIYIVNETKNPEKNNMRLVRAATKTSAVRHVADSLLFCEVAEQETLIELISAGVKVETAADPTPTTAPPEEPQTNTGSTASGMTIANNEIADTSGKVISVASDDTAQSEQPSIDPPTPADPPPSDTPASEEEPTTSRRKRSR